MTNNFKNFFDHEKITAAGKTLVSDQLKLAEEATKSTAAEIEHFSSFIGSLASLKTGDEIANAAITYWSHAGLRSLAFAAKTKENFENAAKAFS